MRIFGALALLLVFVILSGCGRDATTPLLGDIPSRLSPSEVKERIGSSASSWAIVDKLDTTVADPKKGFDYFVARVGELTDMGCSGEAEFEFFNNQLVSVTFFPTRVDEYKNALEGKGIKFELNKLNVRQAEALPETDIFFFASAGSFRFEDRELALSTAQNLAGEY